MALPRNLYNHLYILCLLTILAYATPIFAQETYSAEPLSQEPQEYMVNGKEAGIVSVYSDSGAQYIDVTELFEILGSSFEKNADSTVISSKINNKDIQINSFTRTIIYDGNEYKYSENSTRMIADITLMDISTINQYLPLNIFWAQNRGVLEIKTEYSDETKIAESDLSQSIDKEEEYIPQEEEELFLELKIGTLVYDDIVDGLAQNGKYYLALESFTNALEFPIEIDPETNNAEGWFIAEKNRFNLDWQNRSVKSGDMHENFQENDAILFNDTPYISSALLQRWFPVVVDISYGQQSIHLKPKQLLPFQMRAERENKRSKWANNQREKTDDYPVFKQPYQLITTPYIDFDIDTSYTNTGGDSITGNSSIQASGDFLWMNHSTFVSADKDGISTIRAKLGRYSDDNTLFGSMQLSSFEIGDVDSIDVALANSSTSGRGVNISSYPINRSSEFDSTVIEGDITPGWEVEVYNNNTLLAFQTVGEDGRYRFEDIPISYGTNIIRTVFYGPNGEIREQQQTYDIADAMISKGEFNYKAAINQQNVNTFNDFERTESQGNKTAAIKAEYGLFDWLTMQAGSVFTEVNESTTVKKDHFYQSIGVVATGLGIIHNLNVVSDVTENNQAFQYRGATEIFGISTRLEHIFSDGFYSNRFNTGQPIENATSLDFSGSLPFFTTSGLSYRVGMEHEILENGSYNSRASNSLSTSILGQGITHALNYSTDDSGQKTADGLFSLRGKIKDANYRFNADYDIKPIKELQSASISLSKPLFKKYNAKLDVKHNFTGDKITDYGGTLTWNQGDFLLSSVVNANSEGELTLGAKLSVSLYELDNTWHSYPAGLSSSSAVVPFAYLDKNQNNKYDAKENILHDVTFNRGTQAIKKPKSQGPNFIPISPNYPATISIDDSSFDDPYHYSAIEGVKFVGHSGVSSKLLFPVHEASEIEGFVFVENLLEKPQDSEEKILEDDSGSYDDALQQQALSGVKLYLLDKKGRKIQTITSEYDGYFIFDKVAKGTYDIVMAPDDMEKLGVYSTPQQINVQEAGEIYTTDIIAKPDVIAQNR